MKNSFSKPEKGQGMVEFALVFPLLVILINGIFEVGRVMYYYSLAIAATREVARYGAAIQDTGGGFPQYKDCQGILDFATRFRKCAGISDPDVNPANGNTDTISVTGNSTSFYLGTVYAPDGDLYFSGSSGTNPTFNTQLIGNNVEVSRGGRLLILISTMTKTLRSHHILIYKNKTSQFSNLALV